MKIKKKDFLIIAFAIISVVFTTASFANNEGKVKLVVDGIQINEGYKTIDNDIYVSLQSMANALNGRYNHDKVNNTVTLTVNRDEMIPKIIEEISPSVVGIIGNLNANYDISYKNEYFDEIAHGTGLVIKPNGEILTNAHVVKNMDKIVVLLSDGNGYEGKVLCIDEESDLAIVKIEKDNLKPAKFGKEEDIIIGKTVIAIGTPISFSLRNSASIGIISGVNRIVNNSYRLIQTDAAINPGNSGGPLVNLKGQVIGINSSKYSGTGIEGMGFSIPVNTVSYVVDQFEKYGFVKKPYLGIEFQEDWASKIGLPSNNGLKIVAVDEKSPAKEYGLKVGDVFIAINDVKINSKVDFSEELKKYTPDESVAIKVKRNGAIKSFDILLSTKIND